MSSTCLISFKMQSVSTGAYKPKSDFMPDSAPMKRSQQVSNKTSTIHHLRCMRGTWGQCFVSIRQVRHGSEGGKLRSDALKLCDKSSQGTDVFGDQVATVHSSPKSATTTIESTGVQQPDIDLESANTSDNINLERKTCHVPPLAHRSRGRDVLMPVRISCQVKDLCKGISPDSNLCLGTLSCIFAGPPWK